MIYVVTGCHKSGTTLVSEMLHRSGIAMVPKDGDQGDYDEGNFFERLDWVHLNQDILGFGDPAEDHPAPRQLVVREATREAMRRRIEQCAAAHEDWGFKDPRVCLTYPIWREELPDHVLVGVYRPLAEFWGNRSSKRSARRRSFWKAIRTWCDYNGRLADHLERRRDLGQPFLLVRFETLMNDDAEISRMSEFFGRDVFDARRPERYRSRARSGVRLALTDRIVNALGMPQPSKIERRLERLEAAPVFPR